MSYDSNAWTGLSQTGTWARTRAWYKTLHLVAMWTPKAEAPVMFAFLPSTGLAVTLSSGLSIGLRWRRVLTYTKRPGVKLRTTRRTGRGFFAHGPEVVEAWETGCETAL